MWAGAAGLKLGVIIPYRDRESHLKKFLPHMKEYFDKHNVNFHIYVIHQDDDYLFNLGAMVNIGCHIAFDEVDYFCKHDVDILVQNTQNIYYYRDYPCHLLKRYPRLTITEKCRLFGGVVIFNKNHLKLGNGFSNNFWGWGGEDGDFRRRFEYENIKWKREMSAYHTSLSHSRELSGYPTKNKRGNPNIQNIDVLCQLGKLNKLNYKKDGYNNINYDIKSINKINEYSTVFYIKNNNIPQYNLYEKIPHKYVLSLLKEECKYKYWRDHVQTIIKELK